MPLAGKQIQPRELAQISAEAFDRAGHTVEAVELVEAVAICLAESLGFDRAYHDNLAVLSTLKAGTKVRNPELYILMTVLDPATGKLQLEDGTIEVHPPESQVVVSRDVGLWEISVAAQYIGGPDEMGLYDPAVNADAMVKLRLARGWQPWVAFNTTTYLFDTFVGKAARGVGNYLAEILLTRPAHHLDGTPIEHTWEHPVLDYEFRVTAATRGIVQAEQQLGFSAKSKAQVTEIHQGLARTLTSMKEPLPS